MNIGLGLTATREIVFSALLPFLSKTVTLISFLETVPKVPVIVLLVVSYLRPFGNLVTLIFASSIPTPASVRLRGILTFVPTATIVEEAPITGSV